MYLFAVCLLVTEAKGAISQAETDRKQSEMQMKHNKEQLEKKEADLKKTASSFADDKKQLDTLEREITNYKVSSFGLFC